MGGEVSAGAGLASALFGVLVNAIAVISCVIAVIALAVALLSLRWHLRRREALRTPTQPSRIMPEIGDDVIAMLGHDLDKEIDDMVRRYGRNG